VQLYGYELLGLHFAKLLVRTRPDLSSIMKDEEGHVIFFEKEVQKLLATDKSSAEGVMVSARAWRRRLPRTVDRYLHDEAFDSDRDELRRVIIEAIDSRFSEIGLLRPLKNITE
jgi:hypothetical protein